MSKSAATQISKNKPISDKVLTYSGMSLAIVWLISSIVSG